MGRGVVEECDMPSNPGTHYPATCVKGRFVLMLAFPHTTPAGEDKPIDSNKRGKEVAKSEKKKENPLQSE